MLKDLFFSNFICIFAGEHKLFNMSKIFNLYKENLDKAWYDSSNVLYSECDDTDGQLKTVRVTFSNGRTYQYENVKVNDYLLFREDASQGKALNRIMKQYDVKRIDDLVVEDIKKELRELTQPQDDDFSVHFDGNKVIIMNHETLVREIEFETEIEKVKELLELLKIIDYKCVRKLM